MSGLHDLPDDQRKLIAQEALNFCMMAEIKAHREILMRILQGTCEQPSPEKVASDLQKLIDEKFYEMLGAGADIDQATAAYIAAQYEEMKKGGS